MGRQRARSQKVCYAPLENLIFITSRVTGSDMEDFNQGNTHLNFNLK